MADMQIIRVSSEDQIAFTLCKLLEERANKVVSAGKTFRIGISGGYVKYLVRGLPKISTRWSKWQFFLCEECNVDKSKHELSIYGAFRKLLLPKIPALKKSQMVRAKTKMPLPLCANHYQDKILEAFGLPSALTDSPESVPIFDVLLLRTGPTGQVCGLHPCHRLVMEKKQLIVPLVDPPLPPNKQYITMTFRIINMARCGIFVVTGEVMRKVRLNKSELPLGRVDTEELFWICDEDPSLQRDASFTEFSEVFASVSTENLHRK